MVFSSIVFLYYFLPVTLALYFFCPNRLKNSILLLCSLMFYAWGEPRNIFVMCVSVCFGYGFGRLVETYRGNTTGRIFCAISVGISLSFLLYFKYADFLLENLHAVTGIPVTLLHTALPVGISFYTFQMVSYTVDVSRGETAQRNLVRLALYITMFPQLIAGPIVRYSDIARQLTARQHSFQMAADGIRRLILGLAKKILLADQLGELCEVFRDSQEKSVFFYWIYAVSCTLSIYYDFSGYSDMAAGLGRIFGFRLPQNFDHPFLSGSMTEFWRRWHISLGTWFRDYVYIPLGGNRLGQRRQICNIFIVWILTGLWHGAEWNFVIWGLYFAVLLSVEKTGWMKHLLEKYRIFARAYFLLLILISFVIFHAQDAGQAVSDLRGLFGAGGIAWISDEAVYYIKSYAVVLLLAAAGAVLPWNIWRNHQEAKIMCQRQAEIVPWGMQCAVGSAERWIFTVKNIYRSIEPVALLGLLVVITAYLVNGSFQAFLYFRF
ncbi:MAG: MBOAT family protein [Eubacterium sp.]|nr:MBOAT family protein [Eubacterium sp.]